ncbi:hypothetical protein [Clostridium sp. C2-6-12]|uniref:hypothetical protein n=1 Tax=Clostridium sp. C2-6-12 TaxID=2698832 RepID=UPI00136D5FBC|nr:hypothetical protein [Clostridium sp. C2-6-12]
MKKTITNNSIKGVSLIFFLSISFYMMLTTTYTRALGDYVLEFIGLKSWSGNFSGTHLAVIYFGILTIVLLALVFRFVADEWKIKKRWVFILIFVFVNIFNYITDATVIKLKKNSDGLRTIGYNFEKSKIEYQSKDMSYTKFNSEIEMTNYGNERKQFYMIINDFDYKEDGLNGIDVLTRGGEKAVFELEGNETMVFRINLNDYKISGGRVSQNGGGSDTVKDLVLTDENNNKIRLDKNNFLGTVLNE